MVPLILGVLLVSSVAHAATLGIPASGTTLSGIGVISGWKCETNGDLTIRFDGGAPIPLVYGSQRPDVRESGACNHDRVGFVAVMNWNNLGDGSHTAVVYDDGVEFDRSTFSVVTTGETFLRGAAGQCTVPDFPAPNENARFVWNQATQHMELAEVRNAPAAPPPPAPVQGRCGSSRNTCLAGTSSALSDSSSHYRWQCLGSNGGQTASCQAAKPAPSVSRFNGTWRLTLRYTSIGCTHHADEHATCTVSNGSIRCSTTRGTVSSSGLVSGRLYTIQGVHGGDFRGQLQERSGFGRWHNFVGCGGTWRDVDGLEAVGICQRTAARTLYQHLKVE